MTLKYLFAFKNISVHNYYIWQFRTNHFCITHSTCKILLKPTFKFLNNVVFSFYHHQPVTTNGSYLQKFNVNCSPKSSASLDSYFPKYFSSRVPLGDLLFGRHCVTIRYNDRSYGNSSGRTWACDRKSIAHQSAAHHPPPTRHKSRLHGGTWIEGLITPGRKGGFSVRDPISEVKCDRRQK